MEKNNDFFEYLNDLFIDHDEEIGEIPTHIILQEARHYDLDATMLMGQITQRVFFFPYRYLETVCEFVCDKTYTHFFSYLELANY
jgi:hypothetical protein